MRHKTIVNGFVCYEDDAKTGTLKVTTWDNETDFAEREPKDDAERLQALEQIVLELHAKIKRLSE